jgi:hypothetical protein
MKMPPTSGTAFSCQGFLPCTSSGFLCAQGTVVSVELGCRIRCHHRITPDAGFHDSTLLQPFSSPSPLLHFFKGAVPPLGDLTTY